MIATTERKKRKRCDAEPGKGTACKSCGGTRALWHHVVDGANFCPPCCPQCSPPENARPVYIADRQRQRTERF